MTSAGRRLAGVCTHRTGTRRFMFKIYIVRFQQCRSRHRTEPVLALYGARPGIVQCLISTGNFQISLNKLSRHRPMFYESNCHRCGIMVIFYVNEYIISRENSCKIGRAPYCVQLIFYNAGRAPYDICDHARENS